MPVVVTPYSYVDGAVLTPAGATSHNSNIFSGTGARGILSCPNGGVDHNNLAVGFEIATEHVGVDAVFRSSQDYGLGVLDFTDDAFGSSDADPVAHTIPGCSTRVYVEDSSSLVLIQWTMFAHCWRLVQDADDQDTLAPDAPQILVTAYLGTPSSAPSALAHTRRRLPETVFIMDPAIGPPSEYDLPSQEVVNARSWDMAHLVEGPTVGFYELDLRFFLEGVDYDRRVRRIIGANDNYYTHQVHHRLTTGIVNARAIRIL